MIPISSEQADALRELSSIWSGHRFVLVGAMALGCWMDMRWRATEDIDILIACELEDLPCGLESADGWRRGRHEHQWRSPSGMRIDVIPAGTKLLDAGSVVWPSGAVMSLTGVRLALDAAVGRPDLVPGLEIRVAPLAVIMLLKMASYLDRPRERERDLADLLHAVRDGIALDERVTRETVDADVPFECAGAFILGHALGAIAAESDRQLLASFLAMLRASDDPHRTFRRMVATLRLVDDEDINTSTDLRECWDAFERGFDVAREP